MNSNPIRESRDIQQRNPPPKPVVIRIFRTLKHHFHRYKRYGQSKGTEHQINERIIARWTRWLGPFTIILAITAGITAWILWKTDQTLRLQSRAWIAPRGFVDPTPQNFLSKTNLYTEAGLRIENVGKEPALKVAEEIAPIALQMSSWNNADLMLEAIREATGRNKCDNLPLNPNGRVIWPSARSAVVVGFSKEDTAKINARTHYAMIAGCIAYETLNERHQTEICSILEPVIQEGGWRSVNCLIYNQGN